MSWADYRFGGLGYDPLFSYYRWSHRHDRGWEKDLRGLFAARGKGLAVRPPRNLAQQQRLAKNLLAGNRFNAATVHQSIMLGPVGKLDHKVLKLQTLDRTGQLRSRKAADQIRTVSHQRELVENKLVAQGITAGRKSGAQALQLNLQKPTGGIKVNTGKTPPPLPTFKRVEGTKVNTTNATNLSTNPVGSKVNGNAGNTVGNQGGLKTNTTGNPAGTVGTVKTNTNGPGPLKLNTVPGNTTTTQNGVKTDVKTDAKVGNVTGTQGGKVTPLGGSNGPVKPAGGNTELKTDRIDRTNRTPPTPGGGQGGNNPGFKSERLERTERTQATVNLPSSGNGAGRFNSTNFASVTPRLQSNPTPERVLANGGNSFGRTNANFVQRTFTQSSQPVQTFSNPAPRVSSGGSSGFSGSSSRPSSGGGRRR